MLKTNLTRQGSYFVMLSGIGWLIDFSCYTLLVYGFHLNVGIANYLSAIPAITFVFFTSTRKIFVENTKGISLRKKYAIYVVYQMILLTVVSLLNLAIFNGLLHLQLSIIKDFEDYFQILSKMIITPLTLLVNFIVSKILIEHV